MPVEGFVGAGLASSFHGGDASVGRLVSPGFVIRRKYVSFLIGGGGFPAQTCLNLLDRGVIVRTATGFNRRPGGSARLEAQQWDLSGLSLHQVSLEIVDTRSGGWGHIMVDHIVQTDLKAHNLSAPASRELLAQGKLLLFPVKDGAPKRRVQVLVDGVPRRCFDIELADHEPDWWAPLDIAAWRGHRIQVRADRLPEGSRALDGLAQSDELRGSEGLYREDARAQFHFSARRGWLNDPNGLVFDGHDYHLFFQHNPYGWSWGNMHWGHAVSPDLVHWRELPIALYPHAEGDDAYSGSAVMDLANTAGWKAGAEDVMVAAYTSTGRGECIVYSNDRGRTWTEFEGNPVVRHSGRDPRLLWHAPTQKWVMAVYDEDASLPEAERQGIAFYTSPDLKSWTRQSRIAGFYECPDLFELPLDGNPTQPRWVLSGASSEYSIGLFDGRAFTPQTPRLPGHLGRGFYAAQTFSNEPHHRVIQIGWLQLDTPRQPFNQAMSLPLQLALRSTPHGPRLAWQPAPELESLRLKTLHTPAQTLSPGEPNPLAKLSGELLEVRLDFEPGARSEVSLTIRGIAIRYLCATQELWVNEQRVQAPLAPLSGGRQKIIAFVDRAGVEVFASDGLAYVPMPIVANPHDRSLELAVSGDPIRLRALDAYELSSSWPAPR